MPPSRKKSKKSKRERSLFDTIAQFARVMYAIPDDVLASTLSDVIAKRAHKKATRRSSEHGSLTERFENVRQRVEGMSDTDADKVRLKRNIEILKRNLEQIRDKDFGKNLKEALAKAGIRNADSVQKLVGTFGKTALNMQETINSLTAQLEAVKRNRDSNVAALERRLQNLADSKVSENAKDEKIVSLQRNLAAATVDKQTKEDKIRNLEKRVRKLADRIEKERQKRVESKRTGNSEIQDSDDDDSEQETSEGAEPKPQKSSEDKVPAANRESRKNISKDEVPATNPEPERKGSESDKKRQKQSGSSESQENKSGPLPMPVANSQSRPEPTKIEPAGQKNNKTEPGKGSNVDSSLGLSLHPYDDRNFEWMKNTIYPRYNNRPTSSPSQTIGPLRGPPPPPPPPGGGPRGPPPPPPPPGGGPRGPPPPPPPPGGSPRGPPPPPPPPGGGGPRGPPPPPPPPGGGGPGASNLGYRPILPGKFNIPTFPIALGQEITQNDWTKRMGSMTSYLNNKNANVVSMALDIPTASQIAERAAKNQKEKERLKMEAEKLAKRKEAKVEPAKALDEAVFRYVEEKKLQQDVLIKAKSLFKLYPESRGGLDQFLQRLADLLNAKDEAGVKRFIQDSCQMIFERANLSDLLSFYASYSLVSEKTKEEIGIRPAFQLQPLNYVSVFAFRNFVKSAIRQVSNEKTHLHELFDAVDDYKEFVPFIKKVHELYEDTSQFSPEIAADVKTSAKETFQDLVYLVGFITKKILKSDIGHVYCDSAETLPNGKESLRGIARCSYFLDVYARLVLGQNRDFLGIKIRPYVALLYKFIIPIRFTFMLNQLSQTYSTALKSSANPITTADPRGIVALVDSKLPGTLIPGAFSLLSTDSTMGFENPVFKEWDDISYIKYIVLGQRKGPKCTIPKWIEKKAGEAKENGNKKEKTAAVKEYDLTEIKQNYDLKTTRVIIMIWELQLFADLYSKYMETPSFKPEKFFTTKKSIKDAASFKALVKSILKIDLDEWASKAPSFRKANKFDEDPIRAAFKWYFNLVHDPDAKV